MAGIWVNSGQGWELGSPQGFSDEATLHRLIAENPNLLPLSGSPRLTVLGSEVLLGTGYADILAIEPSGRPAIIEAKLVRNPEARRAIISQVLAYAALLRGMDVNGLENGPLRRQLAEAGHESILDAVRKQDQEGALDEDTFNGALQGYLDDGGFRLILLLDEVSQELERIVAYLDAMTVQALTVDLITVQVYQVNGAQIALPQRVTPDLNAASPSPAASPRKGALSGVLSDGSDAFRASVENTTGDVRAQFNVLIKWAETLQSLPNVRLFSYSGTRHNTLLPYIMPDRGGLVTIWNDNFQCYLSVWRSVFERRAPNSIAPIEHLLAPIKVGQGNTIRDVSPELLNALTEAYREAGNR